MDLPDEDDDPLPREVEDAIIRDEEILEEMQLPGAPTAESKKTKAMD